MARLDILDSISEPGRAEGINDDRHGANEACAFVIDGATGLGDETVMQGSGSDAAWFAELAAEHFCENVGQDSDLAAIVAGLSMKARELFLSAAGGPVERFAWPSASFVMLRLCGRELEFCGLGDCTLFHRMLGGDVATWSPLPDFSGFESGLAASHLAQSSGFSDSGSLLGDEKTMQDLRSLRALQNTRESNVWTLGLVPEAARHIVYHRVPLEGSFRALLCSDGFSALVDTYGTHTPHSLVESADGNTTGLLRELRQIERDLDPDGRKYPRYKQSDDATAILVETAV